MKFLGIVTFATTKHIIPQTTIMNCIDLYLYLLRLTLSINVNWNLQALKHILIIRKNIRKNNTKGIYAPKFLKNILDSNSDHLFFPNFTNHYDPELKKLSTCVQSVPVAIAPFDVATDGFRIVGLPTADVDERRHLRRRLFLERAESVVRCQEVVVDVDASNPATDGHRRRRPAEERVVIRSRNWPWDLPVCTSTKSL